MADLSTLDPTQPPDSESAGSGASRIREERAAIIGSFNLEHALAGAHAFLRGNQGARPAAGNAGRIYLNTTDKRIERDTGSAWNILNAVQSYYAFTGDVTAADDLVIHDTGFSTVLSVSVDVPPGGLVIAIGQYTIISASGFAAIDKIQRDAVDLIPVDRTTVAFDFAAPIIFALDPSAPAGAHTINYLAKSGSGDYTINNRILLVLIV